jgi:hypothetical protein
MTHVHPHYAVPTSLFGQIVMSVESSYIAIEKWMVWSTERLLPRRIANAVQVIFNSLPLLCTYACVPIWFTAISWTFYEITGVQHQGIDRSIATTATITGALLLYQYAKTMSVIRAAQVATVLFYSVVSYIYFARATENAARVEQQAPNTHNPLTTPQSIRSPSVVFGREPSTTEANNLPLVSRSNVATNIKNPPKNQARKRR